MRRVDSLRIRIVIAKHWEDWASNVFFEKVIHANFSILRIRTRELILAVVRDKVSCVDSPGNRTIAICPSQRRDRLKSSQTKVVRRVALE